MYDPMKLDTSWSRLINTPLGKAARLVYDMDERRKYHNWDHICYLYHAAKELGIEYDLHLDMAILFHDIVYDAFPDKEFRSAQMFRQMYLLFDPIEGLDPNRVFTMIMDSYGHKVVGEELLLILDLAHLMDPTMILRTTNWITEESMLLYGVEASTCKEKSKEFMTKFKRTCQSNIEVSKYPELWGSITAGVQKVLDELNHR